MADNMLDLPAVVTAAIAKYQVPDGNPWSV
jgi:hypothetical protein